MEGGGKEANLSSSVENSQEVHEGRLRTYLLKSRQTSDWLDYYCYRSEEWIFLARKVGRHNIWMCGGVTKHSNNVSQPNLFIL